MRKTLLTLGLFLSLICTSLFAGETIVAKALSTLEFSGITQLTDTSVLIEFDSNESYDDVVIYRSTDTSNWAKITTIDWIDCFYLGEYVDKNLQTNKKYYYKLVFYDSYDNQYGDFTEVKSIKLSKNVFPQSDSITVPTLKKVTQISSNKLAIEFESYEDVYIFKKTVSSDWTKIAEVSWKDKSVYIDNNIKPNETYEYKLTACEYSYSYDCNLFSNFSTTKKISTTSISYPKSDYLTTPNLVSVSSNSATSLKLKFDCNYDTYIYRKTSTSDWKNIATLDFWDDEYIDKNLIPNEKYYYKLISFEHSEVYDCKLYSNFSETKSYTPNVATIKNFSAKGTFRGVNLKWSKNSDVTGYKIYMATSKSGKYSLVKTITNSKTTSYEKTGLSVNKKYYFKICGYKTISQKNYTGPFSSVVSATTKKLSYPSKTQLQGYYKSIDVFWEPVTGADGYQIYISTSKNGKYKCVKNITKQSSSSVTIKNLKNLTNYYVKIRAYDVVSSKKVYSDFSKILKIKTISSKASNIKRTIRVTKPEIYEINSVGGVTFEIYWRNQSSKKIKYLRFYVTPYNAVNDPVYWLGNSSTWCYSTGPYSKTNVGEYYRYKGEWETIFKEKSSYSTLYPTYTLKKPDLQNTFNCCMWENVWYNFDVDKIKLSKIKIEYMDGTSKTISGSDIKYAIW